MVENEAVCCPPFQPEPWDEREVTWLDRPFVKDRVRSFLHIPLNFASVMKRNMAKIEAAGAKPEEMIVIADENSLWGADVYIDVSADVPDARMATISGTFLTKVFEGPYKNIRKWIAEMGQYVKSQGKDRKKLYFYYTTCPRCAKKYGKNYVVLLAEV
ncbi:MAG TPA: hydrolase [Thermoguttaceae bacterium]|nr:hydrolase [Thermoguttaceae bacterium]